MPDMEELRERIAERPLRRHQIAATTGREHCCACDLTWRDTAQYRHHLAQAVIDDLGLTVETRYAYATDLSGPDGADDSMAHRVVGQWEPEGKS